MRSSGTYSYFNITKSGYGGAYILKFSNGSTTNGTYCLTVNSGNEEWKDLLTAYDDEPITYDNIGNPLTYIGGAQLTWTDGRRLKEYKTSALTAAYTYDMDGIRQSKTVGTAKTKYITNGTTILKEIRPNGIPIYYFYDENGNVAALSYNDYMYYYVRNILGEIIGLTNYAGNFVAKYSYSAYGVPLAITDGNGNDISGNANHIANVNPYRYKGYYYDSETGFYYLNSRYYNPNTARFINADGYVSTGQGFVGFNMFAYCDNNPVMFVDINGLIKKRTFKEFPTVKPDVELKPEPITSPPDIETFLKNNLPEIKVSSNKTNDEKKAFVNAVYERAKFDEVTTGIPAAIMTAQACWESGYGQSSLACLSYNLFGLIGCKFESVDDCINYYEYLFTKENSPYEYLHGFPLAYWISNIGSVYAPGNDEYSKHLQAIINMWGLE